MRLKIKRCEVCASKIDKNGACTWSECPKFPKYKEKEKPKDKKDE
nr:MAG TPA: Ariadne-1 protein-like protein [Caudoviricetes sp.]